MNLKEVQDYASRGLSVREMSEATGLTLGQVKYRLKKLRDAESSPQAEPIGSEPELIKRTKPEYELPDRYYKDSFQLLVQDPQTLFAYWEVSDRKRWMIAQHFKCDWNDLPKIIRLYDTTFLLFNGHNAHSHQDIQVHDASSYYIRSVKPGTTYVADYGIMNIHGQFIPLIRSCPAETPRNTPAPHINEYHLHYSSMNQATESIASDAPASENPYLSVHPYEHFSTYTVYEPKEGDIV